MPYLYLARQPIYDRKLDVFAYELLYRAADEAGAPAGLGDHATFTVLVNALTEIGLDELVGSKYAFVNLTRGFLVGENPLPFSGNKIVLEVLEDVVADAEVVEGVKQLADQGYMIALDDFVYDESLDDLIRACDLVKLDVMALDRERLRNHFELLTKFGVKLLAEKVETQDDFEFCKALGFDYFQGYFFCKPKVLKRQRVPTNQLAATRLLAKLQDPDIDIDELSDMIGHDVSMTYRLLRYINSAIFSLPSKVESLHNAVVYLGLNAVKQWAMVLAMSNVRDKPHELLVTALVRGKMCELLAKGQGYPNKDSFFLVGLFSVLDALLDMGMDELVESMSLADDINRALLLKEGDAGKVLTTVTAYGQGEWEHAAIEAFDLEILNKAYLDALKWAREMAGAVAAD